MKDETRNQLAWLGLGIAGLALTTLALFRKRRGGLHGFDGPVFEPIPLVADQSVVPPHNFVAVETTAAVYYAGFQFNTGPLGTTPLRRENIHVIVRTFDRLDDGANPFRYTGSIYRFNNGQTANGPMNIEIKPASGEDFTLCVYTADSGFADKFFVAFLWYPIPDLLDRKGAALSYDKFHT